MQVQVHTDHNIEGHDRLAAHCTEIVTHTLGRFSEHITRLEVHLSDENAHKKGTDDKRCVLEVRVEGRHPDAVTHHAESLHEAVAGAATKMSHLLASTVDRMRDHRAAR